MKYRSTRGESGEKDFEEVLLSGMAKDGGLFVPTKFPTRILNDPKIC